MLTRTRKVSRKCATVVRNEEICEQFFRDEYVTESIWIGWCTNPDHHSAQSAVPPELYARCRDCNKFLKAPPKKTSGDGATAVAECQQQSAVAPDEHSKAPLQSDPPKLAPKLETFDTLEEAVHYLMRELKSRGWRRTYSI